MRERFQSVIEDATGRKVIGFMNGNQQDPEFMCEVFIPLFVLAAVSGLTLNDGLRRGWQAAHGPIDLPAGSGRATPDRVPGTNSSSLRGQLVRLAADG